MPEYLKIDVEPRRVQIISEPYVIYTKRGYQPVVDVIDTKNKREYNLFISAKSLSERLEMLKSENNGRFRGLEFWIRKQSYERTAPYILEEL